MRIDMNLLVPAMPLSPACTLSAPLPATAASAWAAVERVRVELVRMLPIAAESAPAPQVHQVLVQAELGKAALVRIGGSNGTSGFVGGNSTIASKRYTDGDGGVPPRGRPV